MLKYLYYFSSALFLLIMTIVLIIITYHLLHKRRTKIFKQKKEEWEKFLFQYLDDDLKLEEAAAEMNDSYFYLYDFLKPYLKMAFKTIDYRQYGGAPLLGVKGIVIISHGSSDDTAIYNAVKAAKKSVKENIVSLIKEEVEKNEELK